MAEDWREPLGTIGANLLSLEVNTVVKPGMVAQKMPEVPVALHTLVELYSDFLRDCRTPLTEYLVRAAASRVINLNREGARYQTMLENWPLAEAGALDWTPAGWAKDWPSRDQPLDDLSNGPETFEALQWAATHAVASAAGDQTLLRRVRSNSRQLKEAATLLEREFSSGQTELQTSTETYEQRLVSIANGEDRTDALSQSRLFGGLLEQTTRALFKHPRPALSVASDVTVLIRKAWDIGLEEVRFQTVMQLDGDVLVQVASLQEEAQRDFLDGLHRRAVDEGARQWHGLFRVLGDLMGSLGRMIFGPKVG